LLASIAPLALVLGLLGGLLWWLRGVAVRRPRGGRHVQVLETVTLGPGQALHLLRLSDRWLLVSSTARRCELLGEWDAGAPEDSPEKAAWTEAIRARAGRT